MSLPVVPDTFRWTEEPWGAALRCGPLEAVALHAFTSRHLRLSPTEGAEALATLVDAGSVAQAAQVHGRVAIRAPESGEWPHQWPEADILVSRHPAGAVAVRTADCVPLLMADRASGAVAAVHAGWRGTAAGAVVAGLDALAREFGTKPADVVVAIGPSIGPCCYQVGTELVDAFAAAGHARHLIDRWFLAPAPRRGSREQPPLRLDLAGANRDQLVLAGVKEESIHACGLCTAMHLDVLTSYRAEGAHAVRLAGVIAPRAGIQPPGRSLTTRA
jgi:YfiH family protein